MSQPKLLLAHHCLYKVIFPTTHKGLLLAPDKQIKAQMPVLKASADSSPDKTRNQILKGKLVGPSTKHSAWWRSAASPKPRPSKAWPRICNCTGFSLGQVMLEINRLRLQSLWLRGCL